MAKKKAAKGKRGGARPGAGRPKAPATIAREEIIARLEADCVEFSPKTLTNLVFLANGGYERVEKKLVPAGLLMVDDVVRDKAGNPVIDDKGRPTKIKVPRFPDLDIATPVEVEVRISVAEPDRGSNQYLQDRVLGRPTEKHEISGDDSSPLTVVIKRPDREPDPDA